MLLLSHFHIDEAHPQKTPGAALLTHRSRLHSHGSKGYYMDTARMLSVKGSNWRMCLQNTPSTSLEWMVREHNVKGFPSPRMWPRIVTSALLRISELQRSVWRVRRPRFRRYTEDARGGADNQQFVGLEPGSPNSQARVLYLAPSSLIYKVDIIKIILRNCSKKSQNI